MSHRLFLVVAAGLFAAGMLAGCESEIRPLQPLQRVEMWVPSDGGPAIELSPPTTLPAPGPALATTGEEPGGESPATQGSQTRPASATQAAAPATSATQVAASEPATHPALPTSPGQKVIKIIDPNETTRFVYKASYDNIWQQAMLLLANMRFTLDRHDYRLGTLITQPLPSEQIVEFWKPEHTTVHNALENTINKQRRTVRLTISKIPGKPDFYQIAVQVLVERQTNPNEAIGGPVFVQGSGFGANSVTLRSDYAASEAARWVIMGHDPALEHKILDELLNRI